MVSPPTLWSCGRGFASYTMFSGASRFRPLPCERGRQHVTARQLSKRARCAVERSRTSPRSPTK